MTISVQHDASHACLCSPRTNGKDFPESRFLKALFHFQQGGRGGPSLPNKALDGTLRILRMIIQDYLQHVPLPNKSPLKAERNRGHSVNVGSRWHSLALMESSMLISSCIPKTIATVNALPRETICLTCRSSIAVAGSLEQTGCQRLIS